MVEKRFTVKAVVSQLTSKRIRLVLIPLEKGIGVAQPIMKVEKVIAGTGKTEEERVMGRIMRTVMDEIDKRIQRSLPGRPEPMHPDTVIIKLTVEEYEKLGKPVPFNVVVLTLKLEAEPVG